MMRARKAGRLFWVGWAALSIAAKPSPQPPSCQLRVSSAPEGAAVTVDGVARDVTPLVIPDLTPGEHILTVSKPNYRTLRQTVLLSPDQRMALDLKLDPLTGLVLIRSDPPGADVRVDDTDRGRTPLLVTDLRVGTHQVTVKAQGNASRTVALEIKDRKPIVLDVALISDAATVSLDSDPPGARVILNGMDSGTTPCTAERVPAGDAFLKMELDGFAPVDQILKLRAGAREEVRLVLKPLPSELRVESIPSGARVYVANQFRGTTPLALSDTPPGSCRIRVEMEGYEPVARTVEIGRAQKTVEEFRLEGNMGILELVTEPSDVRVFVDGQPAGETKAAPGGNSQLSEAWTLKTITVGSHTIQLSKPGYATKEIVVEIQRNQTVSLHEKLQRRFIPDHEVVTNAGRERGVLKGIEGDGSIRLEVRPGIIKTFRAADVKSHHDLRSPTP